MAAHIAQQLSSASLEEDACDDDDVYEVCTAVALVRKTPALDSAELAAVPRGARNLLLEGDLGAVARTGQRRVRWRVGRDEGFVSRRCLRPVAWRAASRRTGRARWRVEVATWAPVLGENGREWRFLMDLVPELEERERVARFHNACDRYKALASRLAARRVCEVCLGLEEVVIARTKGKKPFLVSEAPCDKPNFNFNVSHDGRHVIIAAEPLCIVGVDVCAPDSERKGGGEQDLASMRDMLTAREWAWLGEGDKGERFRLLWSGKEAFAKARGDGLGFAFKRLDLEVEPVRCRDGRKLFTGTPWVDGLNVSSDWRISLEVFEDGHVFALARGPPACVIDAHGLFRATLKQPVISSKDLDADLHAEWTPLCIADLVPDHLRKEYARCVDEDERSLNQTPPPPPAESPSIMPGRARYRTTPPPPKNAKKGSGIYGRDLPSDCAWAVYGRDDDYRASCGRDGAVTSNRGMVLGYLSGAQAGSASEQFLGELQMDATGGALNALDENDVHVLTLHLDGCRLVTLEGSTLCEVARDGRILGPRSQVLGEVRPFSYAMQREVGLYLAFLDPGLLDPGS